MGDHSRPHGGCSGQRSERGRGDEGAAILELALLFPFVALVVFGAIDMGRVFQLKNRLTNMARQGAYFAQDYPRQLTGNTGSCVGFKSIYRQAANEDPNVSLVRVEVRNITTGGGWVQATSATQSGLCPTSGFNPTPGQQIEIRTVSNFTPLTPIVQQWMTTPTEIYGTAEVVVQGVA
jgi:Flp pilus assembly protein TadG